MIFGTDGVRGEVDKGITAELAYNIGKGLAISILKHKLNKRVVIGKDTRLTCDTYLACIASGLTDYGIDVVIIGIVPTPLISFLVSRLDFGGGVMITASHNDYNYNGIKVFNEVGEKANKLYENEIESNITSNETKTKLKGRIEYCEQLVDYYINYLLSTFKCDMSNLTIAIDSANGSNYKIAPYIYKRLGANVIEVACKNDGANINNKCGANHVDLLVQEVKYHNADFGIAFDGDGDRLRLVMRDGRVLSGDDILLYIALYLKNRNRLNNLTVVGTIMTNMGVENTYGDYGIKMIRTDVGDKNVIEMIRDRHLSLGGESSGHICIYEHNPTCDGLLNSLFFLRCYNEKIIDLNVLLQSVTNYPSTTENIEVEKSLRQNFDNNVELHNQIGDVINDNPDARIIVRPSGTEPMIRIYVESVCEIKNKNLIEKLVNIIKKAK